MKLSQLIYLTIILPSLSFAATESSNYVFADLECLTEITGQLKLKIHSNLSGRSLDINQFIVDSEAGMAGQLKVPGKVAKGFSYSLPNINISVSAVRKQSANDPVLGDTDMTFPGRLTFETKYGPITEPIECMGSLSFSKVESQSRGRH